MPTPLTVFARPLLVTPNARATLQVPVLVWSGVTRPSEQGADDEEDAAENATRVGASMVMPKLAEPVVMELRKSNQRMNAFALGITVGRTENNDLVFPDASVSRFHGYFREEGNPARWTFTDAGSTNGTFVGPVPLTPSKAFLLGGRTQIRFGFIEVLFLMPDAFFSYLEERQKR